MAFCEFCGKDMGESNVCDCQASQAAYAQAAAPVVEAAAPAPAPSAADKKKFLIFGGIGVVAVVAIILIVSLFSGGSYKTPVKNLVKLINKGETDQFKYMPYISNPMTSDYVKSVYKIMMKSDDAKDDLEETKEEVAEFYEDNDGLKLSVEFVSADKMKNKDLRDIQENFEDAYENYYEDLIEDFDDYDSADYEDLADDLEISKGDAKKYVSLTTKYLKSFKKVKVTDGYEVKIRINGKRDGDTDHTDKFEIQVLKINGDWFIYNPYTFFSNIEFDDVDIDTSFRTLYNLINVGIGF